MNFTLPLVLRGFWSQIKPHLMSKTAHPVAPLPANATPEDLEMQPVMNELTKEMNLKNYRDKISELSSFQAVKKQNAAFQGR